MHHVVQHAPERPNTGADGDSYRPAERADQDPHQQAYGGPHRTHIARLFNRHFPSGVSDDHCLGVEIEVALILQFLESS